MNRKNNNQAEYMSLQLMEIESFRASISHQSHEAISFNEAAMLWISEGYADKFRAGYSRNKKSAEPAKA